MAAGAVTDEHNGAMPMCPVCEEGELRARPYATWPPPPGVEVAPPYAEQLGSASYEVCSRCGYEFGYDDNPAGGPGQSFEDARRAWEADGRPWPSVARVTRIHVEQIVDWPTFHDVVAADLDFPDYYGRNPDAFFDCVWDLARDAEALRPARGPLTIDLGDIAAFRARCPEQFHLIVDAIAAMNDASLAKGRQPRLFLAYNV